MNVQANDHYLERVVDLLDPALNRIHNFTTEAARERVLRGTPDDVREIDGSFALVARHGKTVRLARSLDRPMRYFLAKREEGPALVVADRIDAIYQWLKSEGLAGQFHPSYTRMVPAHYVVEIQLVGCPDPDPTYTRYFTPRRNQGSTNLDDIGRAYVGAVADEIAKWLKAMDTGARVSGRGGSNPAVEQTPHLDPLPFLQRGEESQRDGRLRRQKQRGVHSPLGEWIQVRGIPDSGTRPAALVADGNREIIAGEDHRAAGEPIGVCFSGGIDSGAIFLVTYHVLRRLGMNPGRLKAFTLNLGDGPDLDQAREFLDELGLGLFLEAIDADPESLDVTEAVRVVEDYKPLDIECATMGLSLCRGIRRRYPDWRYLLDGDGGDENLKDYPIEENPELTIRSVVSNLMLYQEGWGVGRIKHSLTYSGGLSRSYTRTYASARRYGFDGFSPFTRPRVIEVAEGIPFADLTGMSVDRLYALKGEIVSRGVKALTGMAMPVFPKRRFQHGAMSLLGLRARVAGSETEYRQRFLSLYA